MIPKSQYLFATCQVGAEKSLKEELNRRPENLRFAFSRPGFVTFKLPEATPIDGHALAYLPIFARVWGHSIGHVKSKEGDRTKLLQESTRLIAEYAPEKKLQLHVWPRQTPSPEGEPVADTGSKTSTDPMLEIANGLRKQLARQCTAYDQMTDFAPRCRFRKKSPGRSLYTQEMDAGRCRPSVAGLSRRRSKLHALDGRLCVVACLLVRIFVTWQRFLVSLGVTFSSRKIASA